MLTDDQRQRYERNLLIPDWGEAAQERLANASVAVVGLGGLGSPVSMYLTAAGVGTLGLFDDDVIDLSNLQRQVLHTTDRVGSEKTGSARETLSAINPDVTIQTTQARVTRENGAYLLAGYDVVVEASDNFETKYVLNDVCLELQRPFATAGILAMSGQAMFCVPGQSPCLRCAVHDIPHGTPTTAELGVLGAVPGVLGSVQALEVLRWLTGRWKPQAGGSGRLHSIDGDTMRLATLRIPRRIDCPCAPLWQI